MAECKTRSRWAEFAALYFLELHFIQIFNIIFQVLIVS